MKKGLESFGGREKVGTGYCKDLQPRREARRAASREVQRAGASSLQPIISYLVTLSQLLSGAFGTIKSIQHCGNTPWRPEPGRRISPDIPPAPPLIHITSPHAPTLHTHGEGMRRDTGSSMVAPSSARATVSPRAQAPPQSPHLLDSYFDGGGGSNYREGSEQDAEEALVSEGVLCGGYRRH